MQKTTQVINILISSFCRSDFVLFFAYIDVMFQTFSSTQISASRQLIDFFTFMHFKISRAVLVNFFLSDSIHEEWMSGHFKILTIYDGIGKIT